MRLKRVDALGRVALDRALVFQQNGVVVNNAIRYIRRHLQTYHHTAGASSWIKVGNCRPKPPKAGSFLPGLSWRLLAMALF